MKRCPKCNSTYSDETLKFCLTDGTPLLEADGEETVAFSKEENRELRINIPEKETASIEAPVTRVNETPGKRGIGTFLLGALAAFLLLCLVGFGALAIYFVGFSDSGNTSKLETEDTPDLASNTSKEKIKNGEETPTDIDEPPESPAPVKSETPEKPATPQASPTGNPLVSNATVNSPADGFLALRSLPNHKTGKRIAKIPHGAKLTVGGCLKRIKIGKRYGRWCRASYAGKSGWIFDAWITR